MFTPCYE
jgi:hypothetical protein